MDTMSGNDTMPDGSSAPESPYLDTMAPQGIMLAFLTILTLVLDFPCLLWHISSHNLPALTLVGWVMLQNFMSLLNVFIWPIDDISTYWHGWGYCDVYTKLDVGGQMAKVLCAFCILRALSKALDTNKPVLSSGRSNATRTWVQFGLCTFVTVLYAIGQYLVSDRRYYVTSLSGCEPSYDYTWASILFNYAWLPAICYVSCYYAGLIIVRLYRYKRGLANVLAAAGSGMSTSRFTRLCCLGGVYLLGFLPYSTYYLYIASQPPIYDFDWSRIHNPETWQTILLYQSYGQVDTGRWVKVAEGLVVFGVFGFGKDIKVIYSQILTTLRLSHLYDNISSTLSSRFGGNAAADRGLSTPGSGSGSGMSRFKRRTKKILSGLSISSKHTGSLTGSDGSTAVESPSKPHTNHIIDAEKGLASPRSPPRPTGRLEQDLLDDGDDDNANDAAITTTTQAATNLSEPISTHDPSPEDPSMAETSFPAPTSDIPAARDEPSNAQLIIPPAQAHRTAFWQRLGTYVNAMGTRPTEHLAPGAQLAQARGRDASPTPSGRRALHAFRRSGGRGTPGSASEGEAAPSREHEEKAVSHLA